MTFDPSQLFSEWGSDTTPLDEYPSYGHAFGLDDLGNELDLTHTPWIKVYPNFPQHNRLMVHLFSVPTRFSLGCFYPPAMEIALLRGVDIFVTNDIGDSCQYADKQIALANWVDEHYRIVHLQSPLELL